ncbi:MAG: hypothetical protein AB1589_13570 [Cyanobacteriota bacterium]
MIGKFETFRLFFLRVAIAFLVEANPAKRDRLLTSSLKRLL